MSVQVRCGRGCVHTSLRSRVSLHGLARSGACLDCSGFLWCMVAPQVAGWFYVLRAYVAVNVCVSREVLGCLLLSCVTPQDAMGGAGRIWKLWSSLMGHDVKPDNGMPTLTMQLTHQLLRLAGLPGCMRCSMQADLPFTLLIRWV